MSLTEDFEGMALADSSPENEDALQRSLATYRYENALVKTELAATLERHTREIDELTHKYQAQVREVERQYSELESRLSGVQEKEGEQLRKVQQTNLQLQQKIKMLQEDAEEGVHIQEKLGEHKQHMEEQLQQTHLSHQAAMETLRGERNQLSETVDRLRGELEKERITSRELNTTLSTERHQYQLIKSRVTEVEQHCRVQLTTLEAEAAQLRQEREADNAAAARRVKELEKRIEEERNSTVEARQHVEAREVELERNAAEERQTHLSTSHQLTLQNAQLQEKIKTLEGKLRSLEEGRDRAVKEAETDVERATERLHQCERDRAVLEGRVSGLEGMEESLRRERQTTSTLRQDLHLQHTQVEQLSALTTQLHQTIQQLKDKASEMEKQSEAGKAERERLQQSRLQEVADLRMVHQEEVEQLRARVVTLQAQISDRSTKYLDECTQLKQKVRTYARLIKKLRYRVELGGAEMERLAAQRAALEADCVPSASYVRLQTRLKDLTRRHNEFAAFIRGFGELQTAMPEILQLTSCVEAVGQNLNRLEEEQKQCLSELESL
ncbi:hypothetical protein Pmani_027988 [Petrolisthes manimaculis]|uniref:Uncharacterized protein n=1 Tax=Petrolisthes manimaculis TaxID=1843537 RepID=A0AAE1P307_9EUCA|nr:hypothetical protein Pmani_027988 [Petrolisthes manimaculis]